MQHSQLEAMLQVHERNIVTIETSRRVHEKLLDEIGGGVMALTPKNLALGAWYQAGLVWNFEVASIGDKPITVRKIVTGLIDFCRRMDHFAFPLRAVRQPPAEAVPPQQGRDRGDSHAGVLHAAGHRRACVRCERSTCR